MHKNWHFCHKNSPRRALNTPLKAQNSRRFYNLLILIIGLCANAEPLKVGLLRIDDSFPFYVAEQEGLFEKHNVDKAVFGHIHGAAYFPLKMQKNGVEYLLTSCDKAGFSLVKIY